MKTTMTSCHQRLLSLLSQLQPAVAANPRTKTRLWPLQGRVGGCVVPRPKRRLSPPPLEKCLKDSALVWEDEELPKTPVLCLPPRPAQTSKKLLHQPEFQIPPNPQKLHLLPEITRPPKPGLYQTAPILVQCLPLLQPPPQEENKRLTARTPKQRGRLRGGCLSHH